MRHPWKVNSHDCAPVYIGFRASGWNLILGFLYLGIPVKGSRVIGFWYARNGGPREYFVKRHLLIKGEINNFSEIVLKVARFDYYYYSK